MLLTMTNYSMLYYYLCLSKTCIVINNTILSLIPKFREMYVEFEVKNHSYYLLLLIIYIPNAIFLCITFVYLYIYLFTYLFV